MKALTEYIAKSLVDHPEEVTVEEIRHGSRVTLELSVSKEDMGRVIGKGGRVANAIRTLLRGWLQSEKATRSPSKWWSLKPDLCPGVLKDRQARQPLASLLSWKLGKSAVHTGWQGMCWWKSTPTSPNA